MIDSVSASPDPVLGSSKRTRFGARALAVVTALLLGAMGLVVPTAAQAANPPGPSGPYTVSGTITFPASMPAELKQPVNWNEVDYTKRRGVNLSLRLVGGGEGPSQGWWYGSNHEGVIDYNPSTGAWSFSGVGNGTYWLSSSVSLPKGGSAPGVAQEVTVNGGNVSVGATAVAETAQLRVSLGSCIRGDGWPTGYAKNVSTGEVYELEPAQSGWAQPEPRCADGNDMWATNYGNYRISAAASVGTYTIYADQSGTREYYTAEGRGSTKATDAARVTVKFWEGNGVQMLVGTKGPTITGTAAVGSKLTAKPGTWAPEALSTLTYQWKRGGTKIPGATKSSYTPVAADVGNALTVTVAGELTDESSLNVDKGSMTSAATGPVARGALTAAKPKIVGTAKVGKTLKLSRGSWTGGTTFTYRWYRNGKAIGGATKTSYKLKSADVGKKIQVKVTGKKTGYVTKSSTSSKTAKVKR